MSKSFWRRRLYWRIVCSFLVSVGGLLIVQALSVWLWVGNMPTNQQLTAFTRAVAADLAAAIARKPSLDVAGYLPAHYPRPLASLFVVLADGRVVLTGPFRPSSETVIGAQQYYTGKVQTELPASWIFGMYRASPIIAGGRLAGSVGAVPPAWRNLVGRKMAGLSSLLLLLGTVFAAALTLGPVKRRLAVLERSARQIEDGDFTSLAPETGDDELTDLARAFNRMSAALQHRDDQLRQSEHARRLLLADVSHELMTPLTAIRVHRDVLAMSTPATADINRSLTIIGDEALRLERVIGDLLDLACMEAGGDIFEHEHVAVEALFGRVIARHGHAAVRKGVALTAVVGSGAELVYGDVGRLEQALQNLSANALRYTPAGGTIQMRAESDDDEVVISVRDSGAGISPEHLPFVFDRFYKADASRCGSVQSGSGLGLSIARAVVERHGGMLRVESQPHVATVFSITLPTVLRTRPS